MLLNENCPIVKFSLSKHPPKTNPPSLVSAIEYIKSCPFFPKEVAHSTFPSMSYFAIKVSSLPSLFKLY